MSTESTYLLVPMSWICLRDTPRFRFGVQVGLPHNTSVLWETNLDSFSTVLMFPTTFPLPYIVEYLFFKKIYPHLEGIRHEWRSCSRFIISFKHETSVGCLFETWTGGSCFFPQLSLDCHTLRKKNISGNPPPLHITMTVMYTYRWQFCHKR